MEKIEFKKGEIDALKPLIIDGNIDNTEAEMYLYNDKLIKRLYPEFKREYDNKIYTVNELIKVKDNIDLDELIMPLGFVQNNNKIIGFTLPYIDNINFQTILNDKSVSIEYKVKLLKDIGKLLEKMELLRKNGLSNNLYLNDLHEGNFILNKESKKINAVDLDSAKIGTNKVCASKSLGFGMHSEGLSKYKSASKKNSVGGLYIPNYDTEIYSYIVMIFKLFYGENIDKMKVKEYFNYLDYMHEIGVSNTLVDKLSLIYKQSSNENPYEYLKELVPCYGKIDKETYRKLKK